LDLMRAIRETFLSSFSGNELYATIDHQKSLILG
jgi:hypothetical protein